MRESHAYAVSKMSFKKDNGCTNPNIMLGIDQACLSVVNGWNQTVSLFSIPDDCEVCDGQPWAKLSANSNTTVLITSTQYKKNMYYVSGAKWCVERFRFQENGHYGWNISSHEKCSAIYTLVEPTNPYMPILAAFMALMISSIVYATMNFIVRVVRGYIAARNSRDDQGPLHESDSDNPPIIRTTRTSTRYRSIDAFRGIAILLMIFVNTGGGDYVFFKHAPWKGLTVADLVLPWFAWIMGVTIVLTLRTQLRVSISRSRIILKCLKRALILIMLGLIVNSQNNSGKIRLSELRFPGVLQLLGITYFICASIETIGMKTQRNFQYGRFAFLQDILDAWAQWLIVLTLVAIHLLITFLLPVPECPTGYLGPGGYQFRNKYANCTGGAAGYIDRQVFGNHIYNQSYNTVYGPVERHDPEGLMNTLSAVLIVALGVQAGRILFCYYLHNSSKILRFFAWAAALGLIAGFLCNWDNEGKVPVSKHMMTTSFVLTTSCFAFILFGILYYLIDHLRIWNGAPFIYAGTNAIFLYMGHVFTANSFPWTWKINHPTHAILLAMNLWTTTLWALIAYGLYEKDIIITI